MPAKRDSATAKNVSSRPKRSEVEGPASPPTPIEPTRTDPVKLARWKHLTETLLPARAHHLHWPIRLDHCFKRITLDHACNDLWTRHLPKPAQSHLSGPTLDRALTAAESLLTGDRTLLDQLNRESLNHRGKLLKHHTPKTPTQGRRTE